MSNVLWFLLSVVAYVAGLIIVWRVTPRLLVLAYDEGLFMLIAALNILGALLAFTGFVIITAVVSGIFAKILGFLLLVGILIVGIRLALRSWRTEYMPRAVRSSRIIVGIYCFCIALAAVYSMVELFATPK